ncbi:pentatricopeptide repeat-containing protein At2g17670 [Vitis vinifera]|nr:pentatricopeptide repeat-containing protein At2g17670 [Vitis vinifera]
MGKIPPSFRTSTVPVTTLLKNPPAVLPKQSTVLETPQKPHHFPKKRPQPSGKTKKTRTPIEDPKSPVIFNSPNLLDAKKLFASITTTSTTPLDFRFHNALLQSYSSISTVNDSISFLRHMIKSQPSFSPERSTYHILLSQSCKSPNSDLSAVHQTLNLMVTHGFPPDRVTTDIAVRSLCSAGREEHAIELVKELSLKHSPPDSFTYNFIIRHLCKTRALSTVYNFIDELQNSFQLKPDLVTYTILIDNVCNGKNLREATRLLEVLGEAGFKPDCYVYNTIMKGYCILDKGSEAIGVYKKMKEEGVEPDLVTYNTLIFGLSKSGRVKEARKFLDIMAEMGHFPDAVTYTSLMNGLCREGNALGALALLEEMEAKGCSPNSCTYNTLLHGLCKLRMLERGIELYGVMKSGGMKLEKASYATFVRALCKEGRVAEAYEAFDYVVESKSFDDVTAYSTLENSLKWLRKAREQGLAS